MSEICLLVGLPVGAFVAFVVFAEVHWMRIERKLDHEQLRDDLLYVGNNRPLVGELPPTHPDPQSQRLHRGSGPVPALHLRDNRADFEVHATPLLGQSRPLSHA